jgi:hypothetical protein
MVILASKARIRRPAIGKRLLLRAIASGYSNLAPGAGIPDLGVRGASPGDYSSQIYELFYTSH